MQTKIDRIVRWLQEVYHDKSAVVAVSGGVDSAVVLTLLSRALGVARVTPVLLPYGKQEMNDAKNAVEFNNLMHKVIEVDIAKMVNVIREELQIEDLARLGNVMARVRMIVMFDLAKKSGALVCGTENKSEHELGYYTRFGDAASDVEPIVGLYKTDVWKMAKILGLPEVFWTKEPSAGLWDGQTDKGEMGFSYKDADLVLRGKREGVSQEIAEKVEEMVERNKFKLVVPYVMK